MWWMSIEVTGGGYDVARWKDAHDSFLVESALTNGAKDWNWVVRDWGLVFEVCFPDEVAWTRFRALPAVSAALDAVPDPVNGLLVYPGRGGSAGQPSPRRPRPRIGGGAAALPEPREELPRTPMADPRHPAGDLLPG